jgi:hypothetical protein
MKMEFDNVINELFIQFPRLKSAYEEEGDYIRNLPHLCFSIVFVPFVRQAVSANQSMVGQICDFMECMATSEDQKVSELLGVSVLESILSERELIGLLKPYFGSETSKLLSLMEKETGWR